MTEVRPICQTCRFAEWQQTTNGRRHPNGEGKCIYEFPQTPLPLWALSGYWTRGATTVAEVLNREGGRYIAWKSERLCATWEGK